MSLRNLAYDKRILSIQHADASVISIGNITTGGTGKTPFAAWLANWLISKGKKPGLLSRGYHSLDTTSTGNDEKLVLDRLCPNVPHLQQRDRVTSARKIIDEFGCDALLLDDGFQHRRLHRDLDIVLIDAVQPWGYGHILPRGLLREPPSSMRRADLIVITRANQSTPETRTAIRTFVSSITGHDECVEIGFQPTRLVDLEWSGHSLESITGKSVIAFCGIGNPNGFRQTVDSLNLDCPHLESFPDHHHYSVKDLHKIVGLAKSHSVDAVLTTQKDLVKISQDDWQGPALFAVEIGVQFMSGVEILEEKLNNMLRQST